VHQKNRSCAVPLFAWLSDRPEQSLERRRLRRPAQTGSAGTLLGRGGMFGNGSLSAAIRKARLRLSRRAPDATIKRRGCTLEFEGARCAIASASSSNAGGTGRARKLRIDRRSRMTRSRIDACSRFCILSNLNRRTTPADSEFTAEACYSLLLDSLILKSGNRYACLS
jgi:hypothetical protein